MFIHQGKGRLPATATAAAVAAVTFALAGVGMSNALAAPGAAASAPDAASVSYANGGQFTVKPGQSLNDVAIAVTQSHDRATLARASRALFDANPNAFMSHDPSRMRLGAVLTVPVLDASGGLAASAASASATATASGASASTSTSAPAAAAASTPVGTMAVTGAAAATGASSAVAQVNAAAAAAASAASAATHAAAPATPGTASAVTEIGSATPGSGATTAGGAVASAPVAGSQTAAPASGAHEWSGSIQPSASESAAGASASAAVSAAATAQAASQPRAQVSSLQQLLALKNRVLMELQKHGIGGTPAATRAASTGAAASAGASSAAAVSGHGGAATAVSNDGGISPVGLSIAAAVGAALVVLLAALRMRRRKRNANAAAEVSAADGDTVASAQANESRDVASAREQGSARDTSDDSVDVSLSHAAALAAAEREAAEGAAAAREQAEREAAERDAEIREAAARDAERKAAESAAVERAESERVAKEQAEAERAAAELAAQRAAAAEHAAAERAAAEREAAEHAAAERAASEQASAERAAAERGAAERDSLNGATTAASLAAAAELGAEALPLTPLDPVDESFQHEPPAHRLQWDDEPAPSAPAAEIQNPLNVPPPAIDFTQQPVEPRDTPTPFGQPYADASAHPLPDTTLPPVPLTHPDPARDEATYQPSYELHQPIQAATPDGASTFSEPTPLSQAQHTLTAPTEFPRDAVDAFSALDMPLPPRIESPFESLGTPASLTTQPVASPETTAQQALAPHDPDDVPHIADQITAGTAGHAAVAGLGATGFGAAGGLGAAGFGALKLDFDLELPPSPAQPLPAFTPADLTRIARNKLDLAAEYIDLGDLSGARSLINEVIEANDPATRTEARALLSTLAPLS
ncbi:FimV-like protein [Paraburkholderia bryophila]|uniref:FimV-like protein n=2 Tax=Paraburkholderia bryophila TaxID=420952 RepID=A0A329CFJ0_9BURK|nr:FimV-like protein [Paraburkholderia bryophila]